MYSKQNQTTRVVAFGIKVLLPLLVNLSKISYCSTHIVVGSNLALVYSLIYNVSLVGANVC